MAMEKFRAPPLPVPTKVYDQQYMTQVIRILGLYFSQLDSQTPNQANSYRALQFIGGDFNGESVTADDVTASTFTGGLMDAEYGDFTNLVANLMTSGSFQGGNAVFNNLTASQSNASLFTGPGRELQFPHIAASDSTDQYADNDNDRVRFDGQDTFHHFALVVVRGHGSADCVCGDLWCHLPLCGSEDPRDRPPHSRWSDGAPDSAAGPAAGIDADPDGCDAGSGRGMGVVQGH